jgi:hypothetical protein
MASKKEREMENKKHKKLKKGIDKAAEIIAENKDTLDKLAKQEPVTADELDKFYAACNPQRNYKQRRALQVKYEFLKPTNLKEGLMAFGLECDDGWLPILENLFEKIGKVVKKNKLENFQIAQVKEKYGDLCVYVFGGDREVHDLIDETEKKAETTCEVCGQHGTNREVARWFKTECDLHYKRRLWWAREFYEDDEDNLA